MKIKILIDKKQFFSNKRIYLFWCLFLVGSKAFSADVTITGFFENGESKDVDYAIYKECSLSKNSEHTIVDCTKASMPGLKGAIFQSIDDGGDPSWKCINGCTKDVFKTIKSETLESGC